MGREKAGEDGGRGRCAMQAWYMRVLARQATFTFSYPILPRPVSLSSGCCCSLCSCCCCCSGELQKTYRSSQAVRRHQVSGETRGGAGRGWRWLRRWTAQCGAKYSGHGWDGRAAARQMERRGGPEREREKERLRGGRRQTDAPGERR